MPFSHLNERLVPKSELDDIIKEEPTDSDDRVGIHYVDEGMEAEINKKYLDVPQKDLSELFTKVEHKSLNMVECNICYKKMKESSMKQHCQTHSKVRPHPCTLCDQRFTRRSDMYRHQRVLHRKQKPFACKLCRKAFSTRTLLLAHLRNHASSSIYECGVCHYKFGKKEYYDSHVSLIHPGAAKTSATERKMIVDEQINQITKQYPGKNCDDDGVDADRVQDMKPQNFEEAVETAEEATIGEEYVEAGNVTGMEISAEDSTEVDMLLNAENAVASPPHTFRPPNTHGTMRKKRKRSALSRQDTMLSNIKFEGENKAADQDTDNFFDAVPATELAEEDESLRPQSSAYEATMSRLLESSAAQARDTLASLAGVLGGQEVSEPSLFRVSARVGGCKRSFGVSLVTKRPIAVMSQLGLRLMGDIVSASCGASLEGVVQVEPLPGRRV